jgi:Mannosyl-glycoprotein endo-beta-N-acetylglucosaminidase
MLDHEAQLQRDVRSQVGCHMMYRVPLLAALAACSLAPFSAAAADLPPIRISERNIVPECATPGRMMAFLRARNDNLDPRFEKLAVYYMRYGEELGLRWDYAFVQMAIETGYLTFKRDGNKSGLVKPAQNNFAGLGAVGKGEPGESFKDVATGVLAHLQHVLLYAGEAVENPVAERTRKVAEWGVLKPWQAKIKGPTTFAHLAQRWAATSDYAEAIETHADRFYAQFCKAPDPNPDLVAEARNTPRRGTEIAATAEKPRPVVTGADLARQAIEDGKAEGNAARSGLGASFLARAIEDMTQSQASAETAGDAKAGKAAASVSASANPARPDASLKPDRAEKTATVQTASAAAPLARQQPPAAAAGPKCRVWTASYGGQKAIIIKAQNEGAVNYTVLDVNDGAEKREADAYIAAYARGGTIAGEFTSPTQALDKAFELCPEN